MVSFLQAIHRHMGVDLRGGEVFMTEKLLDAPQISSSFQQVGRIAVPQLVRR